MENAILHNAIKRTTSQTRIILYRNTISVSERLKFSFSLILVTRLSQICQRLANGARASTKRSCIFQARRSRPAPVPYAAFLHSYIVSVATTSCSTFATVKFRHFSYFCRYIYQLFVAKFILYSFANDLSFIFYCMLTNFSIVKDNSPNIGTSDNHDLSLIF